MISINYSKYLKKNKISNKPNKEKMFIENVDKFIKRKSVEESKEKKNKARKLQKERKIKIIDKYSEFIESLVTNHVIVFLK